MVVIITAASVQERNGAKLLFTDSCKKLRRVWVDGGYSGSKLGVEMLISDNL